MLLKSLNYWSVPGGLEGTLDPIEFIRIASEHRFPAVELAIGEAGSAFGIDVSEARCREILDAAAGLGVQVTSTASGLYWGRALGDAEASARAQANADLEKMLHIASWLGVRTHLTIPGSVDVFFLPDRAVQAHADVWRYASEGISQLLPTAKQCQVRLGIENVWNKFIISPQDMATFVDQFDSPWIGAYVDVGNLQPFGYAEDWLRKLGERVVGIHFKDYRRAVGTIEGFVDLLEGDVNWPEVMAAIRDIGFDGPIVAEMIPYYRHHPMVRIANTSNAMDAILAG